MTKDECSCSRTFSRVWLIAFAEAKQLAKQTTARGRTEQTDTKLLDTESSALTCSVGNGRNNIFHNLHNRGRKASAHWANNGLARSNVDSAVCRRHSPIHWDRRQLQSRLLTRQVVAIVRGAFARPEDDRRKLTLGMQSSQHSEATKPEGKVTYNSKNTKCVRSNRNLQRSIIGRQ
jgi:hypothetical protein